ncbi:MAG: TolC family protein [Gammaproteobacteria bacterium]|nr:TolC family protein [Gammaproteobacteria bacterium]
MLRFGYQVETCRFGKRALGLYFVLAVAAVGYFGAAGPASASSERELTLAECIALAIRNNRDLAAGRLDRLAQKLSLQDAEDQFRPSPAFGASARHSSQAGAVTGRSESSNIGVSPSVTLRMPAGGSFTLGANNSVSISGGDEEYSQGLVLSFEQPLLRGGGTEVGTASIVAARRAEQGSVLGFKSVVIGLVTRTIFAYRSLIRSMRAVEIAKRSVQRARELLEVNRILIDAGRMAKQDIVQTEANIAERELGLTEAEGSLNDARLALIDILEIDSGTLIRPTEPLRMEEARHDAERGVMLALKHRPDYLRALLGIESAETALMVADNARKWRLDLSLSAGIGHRGRSLSEAYRRFDDDYGAALSVDIPVGANADARQRSYERARIALRRTRLQVAELRQSIDVEVRAALRDVKVQFRRAELARRARELTERKLEIERIKLNSGLTTNFRLVRFEDDLVRSQNNEVGAVIAYLNALTSLDRTLGTTLDTWRIEVDSSGDGVEEK